MADVTFGVKVSEEMKGELSELMKGTQLTGKEFMNLLVHTYKLEQEKAKESVISSDIDELQRLLQRIQHLYINMNERTQLVVEDRLGEKDEVIKKKDEEIEALKEQIKELEEKEQEGVKAHQVLEEEIVDKDKEIIRLKETIDEQKVQIKQQSMLEAKFEQEVKRLTEQISQYERLQLEIDERNEEITKLKNRNDELASEVWFMQRENEKLQKEQENTLEKKEHELEEVKSRYALENKNALLEQKLQFNQKIEILREEQYELQQQLNNKIQELLLKQGE
ncbi:MAG: hypothetical protein ACRDDX_04695 [Cellulosilyticaceae bacterium]